MNAHHNTICRKHLEQVSILRFVVQVLPQDDIATWQDVEHIREII